MIGRTLGHYHVTGKLGAGGMGEVYRASDSRLGRDVALKVVPSGFARDPDRLSRFRREAQVLAQLNHPNIGAIYGFEEADEVCALVLELIEGPTLAEVVRRGPVPVAEALSLALQIAEAVEAAHERGVVHRDLKPDNVKVAGDGQVKVLDFGLAKALDGDVVGAVSGDSPTFATPATGALTGPNVILGTAGYMSPEQARGKSVDKRADIWAFGVILFEMLTGRGLFAGETVSDSLAAVLKTDPDWESLPRETPPRVVRLLRRCLERDPHERLRDIGDARIALQEVIAGEGEEPVQAATATRNVRGRALAISGVAILAAVAGATLGVLADRSLLRDAPEPGGVQFRIPVPDLANGRVAPSISPDGRHVVYASQGMLWLRDLTVPDPHPLEGTEGGMRPFWSPDGEWIAYADSRRLNRIRISGGPPRVLCELPSITFNAVVGGGAWTRDGRIVFTDGAGPLWSLPDRGADPEIFLPLDPEEDQDFHDLSALPGGKGYLFAVHAKNGPYDRIDLLAGGKRSTVVRIEGEALSRPVWSPSGHLLFGRRPTNPGVWAVPFSLSRLEVTGAPFLVVPGAAEHCVSQDGTLVVTPISGSAGGQLLWVDGDGRLGAAIRTPAAAASIVSLSPDETRLAVFAGQGQGDLFAIDLVRETATRLTFLDQMEMAPAWSPDGDWIYYLDVQNAPGKTWMVPTGASGEPVEVCDCTAAIVSPDGKQLLFTATESGDDQLDWDIFRLDLDEQGLPVGERALVVDTPEMTAFPRLSPDGRYLAYAAYSAEENGAWNVFLQRYPSGAGKWQVSSGSGMHPRWKGDGTELYYASGKDVMAVDLELGEAVRVGTPRLLFSRPDELGGLPYGWPDAFEVARDGKRFIICVPEERNETEGEGGILVMQGWAAGLEQSSSGHSTNRARPSGAR